jgi:hypothetical protein
MRNLSLSSSKITSFSGVSNICAAAIDLDHKVLYAASELQNHDAAIDIEIWKVALDGNDEADQVCNKGYI